MYLFRRGGDWGSGGRGRGKRERGGEYRGDAYFSQVTIDVRWTTSFIVRCDENDVCKCFRRAGLTCANLAAAISAGKKAGPSSTPGSG